MKKFLSFLFAVFIFSLSLVPAFAVYYDDTFPSSETGLTGGLFLECSTNIGNCVIIVPYNYKDNTFTFSTNGNVFNASSSTVTGTMFRNGQQYSVRWSAFSYPQYRQEGNSYSYIDLTVTKVTDTNIVFITDDSELSNDNYYFSTFEKILIILLCFILFFVFLSWFLLHRR